MKSATPRTGVQTQYLASRRVRTLAEQIADIEEQIANLQQRLNDLYIQHDQVKDYMADARSDPAFRRRRQRRAQDER